MTAALATPSASTTIRSLDPVESACQEALDEIHALSIRTFEKIIPCTEHYNCSLEKVSVALDRHGEKLFEFLKFTQELNQKRAHAKELISIFKVPVFLAWASFAKTLKVGACDELCCLLLTSEKIKGLHALRIVLRGTPKTGGTSDDHVVLAFSEKPLPPFSEITRIGKAHDADFLKTFHALEGFVIVDPYLNKAIRSSDLLSHETYNKELLCMENTHLKRIDLITDAFKSSPEIDASLTLFQKALSTKVFPDPVFPPSILPILIQKRCDLIQKRLSTLYPSLTWKWHESKIFWTKGESSSLSSLQKELTALGLEVSLNKIKDSPEFCLRISCPSYTFLEKAFFALSSKA